MQPWRHRRVVAMTSGGGAAAFSPASIPGLKLWLDASQIVGLNDGDAVTTWSDLSGNGNDGTQATSSKKPTYQTSEINGRAVVLFDGVDDMMTVPALSPANCSAFAVFKKSNAAAIAVMLGNNVIYGPLVMAYYTDSYFYPVHATSGGSSAYEGFAGQGTALSSAAQVSMTVSGSTIVGRVNGSSLGSPVASGAIFSSPSFNELGARTGSIPIYHDGSIAELLLYDSAISAEQIVQIETYLKNKWGTP
jgi:hypothetical protein